MKTLFSLFKILLRRLELPQESKTIINSHANHSTRFSSDQTIMVFDLEAALLKSSSLFPYFMLVAFEAGGLIRALFLLIAYPFVCSVGKELGLKIMTFICFVGIREDKFRAGSAVLPKFFLEDVGCEGFDLVMRCERKIGVSKLPRIMVEGFLKDYIGVEGVMGREMKVVCGYFLGLMEEKEVAFTSLNEILLEKKMGSFAAVVGCSFLMSPFGQLLRHCKVDNSLSLCLMRRLFTIHCCCVFID